MSTCAPWTLKNECANPQCQHEKDSHHEGKYNCLVLHCDCKAFKKAGEKEPPSQLPTYRDPSTESAATADDDCPDTPRMPGWPWGSFP